MSRVLQLRKVSLANVAIFFIALASLSFVGMADAAPLVLYEEHFNTDVPDLATFASTYPGFTQGGTFTGADVTGGVLHTFGTNNFLTRPGFAGDLVFSVDVGAQASNGNYNVGLRIGSRDYIFHPGFAGPPQGAFRVEGVTGNTEMGYVPANLTLHHMEIRQRPTGEFDITITDGNNPLNVFTTSHTHLPSVGGAFGLVRGGGQPQDARYDNLVVRTAADLISTPFDGDTIDLGATLPAETLVLQDAITLQNVGYVDSVVNVLSASITGVDAANFSIPDFAVTDLTVGGIDSVLFDVAFDPNGELGIFSAQLTITTSLGDVIYNLTAASVPEPASASMLTLSMLSLVATRRRKRVA